MEQQEETYNVKLSKNDINIIFSHLKKGIWENVNDTIQSIYSQKTEEDIAKQKEKEKEQQEQVKQ